MTMGLISARTFIIFAFLFFITTPRFYLATLSSFGFHCRHGLGKTSFGLRDGGKSWGTKLGGDSGEKFLLLLQEGGHNGLDVGVGVQLLIGRKLRLNLHCGKVKGWIS